MDSLLVSGLADSVSVVAYHPHAGDTFAIPPDDSIRLAGYQHKTGEPAMVLDGWLQFEMPSDPAQYYERFRDGIARAKSSPTYVYLDASGSIGGDSGQVMVSLAIESLPEGAEPKLFCILTEDSLVDQSGQVLNHVPRRFLPDVNGKSVRVVRGDTLHDTLQFSVLGYRPEKLGVVLFVQDVAGQSVMQAFQIVPDDRTQ